MYLPGLCTQPGSWFDFDPVGRKNIGARKEVVFVLSLSLSL